VAVARLVVSATELAVIVTVAGVGTPAGAIKVIGAPEALAVAESVPHVAPLQPAPESVQTTPLSCESFCTVAVKFAPAPTGTVATLGDTDTIMAGVDGLSIATVTTVLVAVLPAVFFTTAVSA